MTAIISDGHKAGTNRVAKPEAVDFQERNVIHKFEDGWAIYEDKTPADVKAMAKATRTCVLSLVPHLWPENELLYLQREKIKACPDYDAKTRSFKLGRLKPVYRLMHLESPDKLVHACIVLADAEICDSTSERINFQYTYSRDLGAQQPLPLDDKTWYLLEARLGTGKRPADYVMDRVITWYKALIGEDNWNQQAYDNARVPHYEAIAKNRVGSMAKDDLQWKGFSEEVIKLCLAD